MSWLRPVIALLLVAMFAALSLAQDAPSPQDLCDAAEPDTLTPMQFEQAEQVLEPDTDYRAVFCTSAGAIYVDLYENLTPVTVNNFVFLAQQDYYDSTSFHRVIPNFMAQGGDPTGTGRGGPGYRFEDEPVGFLTFDRPGLLAMANAGPGTNGSQFFITTAPTPHLNYKHTIFGDVLVGQDIVAAIRERDPSSASQPGEALLNVLIITDPAEVDSSGEVALEAASLAQVAAAFEAFAAGLPPSLPLDAERSGFIDTEMVAAGSVADDLQDGFAAFSEQRGHRYRYRMQIANGQCDPAVFFSSLGYWVDVFADAESAAAAATDEFMLQWLDSYGYERDPEADSVYTHSVPTCNGDEGVQLLALYPRGRFLATIDVLVARSILDQASPAAILGNLSLQIEGALSSVFRPEIRA